MLENNPTNDESRFSLKDALFNAERLGYLAELFRAAERGFNVREFLNATVPQLPQLELKARISHIATSLEKHLPDDFPSAARIIVSALPPPLDPTQTDGDFGDFIFAPLGEYVVRGGLSKSHLRLSLATLKELTQRFSMEYAIRPFINAFPDETLRELKRWSQDSNYHVRRLVSEGTRPLLPWAPRIRLDIEASLALLDVLHADPTRYVTRSVANHLNDIAKSRPELVVETLTRWQVEGQQDEAELRWMSKQALRTLVKRGHPQSLKLLGFSAKPKISVEGFTIKDLRLEAGQALEFSVTIVARQPTALLIDYVVEFVKSNGSLAPKVFKLKSVELGKNESLTLNKQHRLLANATTYRLYPGKHFLTLQINGQSYGRCPFEIYF